MFLSANKRLSYSYVLFAASKKQLAGFISSLHGHVASLLRHMVGSVGMFNYFLDQIFSVLRFPSNTWIIKSDMAHVITTQVMLELNCIHLVLK